MSAIELEHVCPHCDKQMDRLRSLQDGQGPSPGDSTICMYCARCSIFCEDLTLRKPTKEEDAEIADTPEGITAFAMTVRYLATKVVLAVQCDNGQLLVFNDAGEQMDVFQGPAHKCINRLRMSGYTGEIQGPVPWPFS
jgi:hypothetical protein